MRISADLMSRPVPAALPMALLGGGLACDIVARRTGDRTWSQAGRWMTCAGMIGVTAAMPRLLNDLSTAPPRSPAHRRASAALLGQVGALAGFAAAWFGRESDDGPIAAGPLTLEIAGAVLMTTAGWTAGTRSSERRFGASSEQDAGSAAPRLGAQPQRR